MNEHEGFTIEGATTTEAGRVRGVILDTIASRVGQVADVHPRLLEGIEVAARALAPAEPHPRFTEFLDRALTNPEVREAYEAARSLVVGAHVTKPKGYPYPGTIVAVFANLAGDRRLVVESDLAPGMLHIFSPSQVVVD